MSVRKIFFGLASLFFVLSCRTRDADHSVSARALIDDTLNRNLQMSRGVFRRVENLTDSEKLFLRKLAKENQSIIWGDEVERYYASDSSIILSRLVFPDGVLLDSGYVYYTFQSAGRLSDALITYNWDRGQGSVGHGSVTGTAPNDYIHSFKVCGVTACFDCFYVNGKEILDKKEK